MHAELYPKVILGKQVLYLLAVFKYENRNPSCLNHPKMIN